MIIFLFGADTYRSQKKLQEITEHYKKIHKSGLNLKYFDFQENDFEDFKNVIQQNSMFCEKKLIVLKECFASENFKENFLKDAKKFVDLQDIILFYETEEPRKNNALFKFLEKNARCQEFKPLEGQSLKNWVQKEFKNYQTDIDSAALEKLIDFIGNDLWQFSNEIKKLVSFKNKPAQILQGKTSAGKEKIEEQDIKLLVRPKIETHIFKTIDAIASKNNLRMGKKQAIELVHKHLQSGAHPLYLLTMITFQFRNLLIVKDLIEKRLPYNSILKRSKLHPFVVRKTCSQARQFSFEQLKKIYQKIFQADLNIKTGRVSPETALDLLIIES
ncbi:DNA polymerase III subunit delta [Candidatus Parcubacteria bacterium]|nr:DNA polymerase III subunit delta [Candidatus Parcubacteria bacterium]